VSNEVVKVLETVPKTDPKSWKQRIDWLSETPTGSIYLL